MCEYCENEKSIFKNKYVEMFIRTKRDKDYKHCVYIFYKYLPKTVFSNRYSSEINVFCSKQLYFCPFCGKQFNKFPFQSIGNCIVCTYNNAFAFGENDDVKLYCSPYTYNFGKYMEEPFLFMVFKNNIKKVASNYGINIKRIPIKYCPLCGDEIHHDKPFKHAP